MRTFTATLGGTPVTIYAPEPGTLGSDSLALSVGKRIDAGLLGLDVEGTYMDDLGQWSPDFGLRLVQLAPNDDEAWVLTVPDLAQRAAAVELLTDPDLSFTSHTQMDVLSVARVLGVDITMRNADTRAVANMAYTDRFADRSLKALCTRHGMPELAAADEALYARFDALYREAHPGLGRRAVKRSTIEAYGWEHIGLDDPLYLAYAGLDAIAVRRLLPLLVAASGDAPALIEREVWLAGRANRIQLRGMLVDVERLDAVEAEAEAETAAAEAVVAEVAAVRLRSPKLKEWLADHGVDWGAWVEHGGALTAKGAPSLAGASALVLRTFPLDSEGAQAVEAVVRAQSWADRLTKARGVRAHLAADGRVHPVLIPNGATATSRMSSSSPNFQNFSPATMGVFVADPGHVLGRIDFEQVELRVVAALARERKMIDVILAGGDLHQLTADELGIPRKVAKPTNFLIVYGGGGKALAGLTGLPLDECYDIVRRFYDRYPSIAAYAEYLGDERDAVYTVSGRRLPVAYTKGGDARHWANINFVVQSSARDLLVDSWLTFDAAGYGDMIWFPVHDEFVLQAPAERWDEVAAAAERAMRFDFRGVPIAASAEVLRDEDGVSRWGK